MSTKNLDINLTDGANYDAGQVGENRAVELFIHVPQDMYNLEHSYRLVFSNGVVTPMLQITPPENDGEDGVIRYLLESELTSSSNLGMQLEEYGEDGLIDKSSVVSLKFGNSLSKPKEIFFNKDIILEINNNTIFAQKHQSTLDSLSVVDGKLFVDGKPIVGVVVWHIVDDPVNVPSMDDGTLLFISPGINGDMSYPPYKVLVLGAVVTKIAPWKPGQLWVCRGGVWYLLATANRQEYTPEEVVPDEVLPEDSDIPQDVGGSVPAEEEVYEVDPCENVDKSGGIVEVVKTLQTKSHTHSNLEILESVGTTDDVVLMPMGEPLNLMIREDFASLQFPIIPVHSDLHVFSAVIQSGAYKSITVVVGDGESFINFHDSNASINVSTTDGLAWYDGETMVDAPDLTGFKIDYFETDSLGITSETLEDIEGNQEVLSMYKTLCRAINTSVENMGSVRIEPDVVEALPANGVRANRTYAVAVGAEGFSMQFDRSSISGGDAYAVVYLNILQDCDIAFDADLYVGGESPNTKAGMHKLIYNVLPNGQVSLGALDLEAVV